MKTELPGAGSVLVLAPHPDDEALGCGGTIALLNRKGAVVRNIYLTSGERIYGEASSDVAEKRTFEARLASQALGCAEPFFLNLPDGDVSSHLEQSCKPLRELIERYEPELVFAPSPLDYHADHLAASRIAFRLMREMRSFRLAFYEVYSTIRFTHLIDVTDVIELKKKAISGYHVSLYGKPDLYIDAALGVNTQRSIFFQKRGYFEAFWVLEKPLTEQEAVRWLTYDFSL